MHPLLTLPLLFATNPPTVTIELPTDTPDALIERVVDSCNQALGEPRCRAAPASGEASTLYALVSWEGVELAISLRQGTATGVEVDSRHVAFSDSDVPEDRYIAAGLMVAALAAAQANEVPAAEPAPEPAPVPPRPPIAAPRVEPAPTAPAVTAPETPLHLGLDLGAEAGPGLRGQRPKWGGALRLWWLAHAPRIGASASASLLGADDDVTLRWTTLALGFAARVTPWDGALGLDLLCEATAQHTEASASVGAETDSDALWRFGGRLGAVVSLDTGSWIQPYLGATLTLLDRGLEVTLAEDAQGSEPGVTAGGSLGVRLAPF
ncbi:MAG TPA: hypothetical protein VI197_14770 [Polyangiaceae bacterium]